MASIRKKKRWTTCSATTVSCVEWNPPSLLRCFDSQRTIDRPATRSSEAPSRTRDSRTYDVSSTLNASPLPGNDNKIKRHRRGIRPSVEFKDRSRNHIDSNKAQYCHGIPIRKHTQSINDINSAPFADQWRFSGILFVVGIPEDEQFKLAYQLIAVPY